ncbi:MAG: MotA/TolQ/ExbB proton channel family protein [Geminocystis sp.]|nr:MotA/TolQ/ExbB proton channel family protein [Geminocystis sp.]HIK37801.1 MotA/TolQ/ExbB proton channel family protein [Geminocystis sp. M7585_C2015_104]MCS7149015.1 MotA/TolQ/ExbB proton channel family protein [Geminocystis sp.]MCX8078058.1 MotA/TolQ/ExbB proton channel family protein [Geminocystis sp.]MDW8114835.1 MotA/TolQ/ExbB proton channel family protein [Geminocystis sp.]
MIQKKNKRQELDTNFFATISGALAASFLLYILIYGFSKDSYIGSLLLERGFTQPLTVFCAFLVVAITIDKYLKVSREKRILKNLETEIEQFSFRNHKSVQLLRLREDLYDINTMVTNRLGRIVAAYVESGSRKAVTDFALDDSSFYLSASEASYAVPRILVWAIPLLGFIGTVLGISSAVSGFTGFLDNTADVEQIKEGISAVTSGLAVAFDTTLLALLLSVAVMIPLVLVEKMESNLLLAVDIFINDCVLPLLQENSGAENAPFNTQLIVNTITDTLDKNLPKKEELIASVKQALPTVEELVSPAEKYAQEAAKNLVDKLVEQFQSIHHQEQLLLESIRDINGTIIADRAKFLETINHQNYISDSVANKIEKLVDLMRESHRTNSQELIHASQNIVNQLNQISENLGERIASLQEASNKIAKLQSLKTSLEQIVDLLKYLDDIHKTMASLEEKIEGLKPTLQELSKPRVIRLVEQIEK